MRGTFGRTLRVLGVAGLVVLAVAVGIASVFVARLSFRVGGVPLPWGLVLAAVAPATLIAAAAELRGRVGALATAAAWFAVVIVAVLPRSGGDVVVAGDGFGMGFVLLALAVAVWAVVRFGIRRRQKDER